MDKVKFPDWTPPDLIRCYEEVKQDDDGDEELLDCLYRLGTEKSMQDVWTWLIKNQRRDIPHAEGSWAEEPLVFAICSAVGWSLSLAKQAEINHPIPLNESNKKLTAISKKAQSLIRDIEGNHQANQTSRASIERLVGRKLRNRIENLGLNGHLFTVIGWKKRLEKSFEELKTSLVGKSLQTSSTEEKAILFAQDAAHLGLVEALEFFCFELNNKINQKWKISKSVRVHLFPNLNQVFKRYFLEVPKDQFCELASVIEFDRDCGFNSLSWSDIRPYLS